MISPRMSSNTPAKLVADQINKQAKSQGLNISAKVVDNSYTVHTHTSPGINLPLSGGSGVTTINTSTPDSNGLTWTTPSLNTTLPNYHGDYGYLLSGRSPVEGMLLDLFSHEERIEFLQDNGYKVLAEEDLLHGSIGILQPIYVVYKDDEKLGLLEETFLSIMKPRFKALLLSKATMKVKDVFKL